MSSLGEVQRIIGLSLSKIQTGRNQRGGLPLHKNLLVATVLNKARDIYMQETMYMNYRLMACGQFGREEHDEVEEEDAPDPEDYDEDSESDVEDDAVPAGPRDYVKDALIATANNVGASSAAVPLPPEACIAADGCTPQAATLTLQLSATSQADLLDKVAEDQAQQTLISDEGFIDESDCECDARNFGDDGESRVPFQYCFNCAPFHPSNGRGPTLVSPHHQNAAGSILAGSSTGPQEQEDKLIYDMDLKSTRNQPAEEGGGGGGSNVKRKRQISREEGDEASSSLVPKRRRDVCNTCDVESANLDDSGYQGESDEVREHQRAQTYACTDRNLVNLLELWKLFCQTNGSNFDEFILKKFHSRILLTLTCFG